MFCRQCGSKLLQDARFCNQCGMRVTTEESDGTQKLPPQGRITVQFGNSPGNPQLPPIQFGNSPSNPNNPQFPPTLFEGNQGNPQFPPTQFGGNSQPLQSGRFGGSPSNPQFPPTQFGGSPGSPPLPPTQFGSSQQLPPGWLGNGPGSQQLPPTQFAGSPSFQSGQFELQPGQFGGPGNPHLPPTQFARDSQWPQFPPTQFAGNSPFAPTQFAGNNPLVLPPWSQPIPASAPAQATVVAPSGPSATQHLLINIFQPALAGNALLGILLGGILAAVLGGLASILVVVIAHALAPHVTSVAPGSSLSGESIVDSTLGIVPLFSPWRDGLQLFLVAHGVGLHVTSIYTATSSGNPDTYTSSYSAALNGLLVIPALLLTPGGYIAASTDFQNRLQTSLLRGAAIAIPYTILLFIMAYQANGCIPGFGSNSTIPMCTTSPSIDTVSVDNLSLFVFGILWGGLFGLLGGSLKFARGQWRQMLFSYLRTLPRPQLAGMITGGLAATGLGIALSLLVLFGLLAYTEVSIPLLSRTLCERGDWQVLTFWGIVQGPLHAVNLFFLSFGAPLTISHSRPVEFSCFYTSSQHLTLSLFDGSSPLPAWRYALLAIPVISLFLGGRVSAAVGRAIGAGPGAIQGLIITAPFTVLMVLLTFLCTITTSFTEQTGGGGSFGSPTSSTTYMQSAGADLGSLLLWALLSGAILGASGGAYQTSGIRLPSIFSGLARGLSAPVYGVVNLFSRQHRSIQRTNARNLLYSAVFCAFLLAIVAGAAGGSLIGFNETLSLTDNQHIKDIVSVIVIAFPGLLLIGACASALSHAPSPGSQASGPAVQFVRGVNL